MPPGGSLPKELPFASLGSVRPGCPEAVLISAANLAVFSRFKPLSFPGGIVTPFLGESAANRLKTAFTGILQINPDAAPPGPPPVVGIYLLPLLANLSNKIAHKERVISIVAPGVPVWLFLNLSLLAPGKEKRLSRKGTKAAFSLIYNYLIIFINIKGFWKALQLVEYYTVTKTFSAKGTQFSAKGTQFSAKGTQF